jgi:hypothetical protein
MPIRPQMDPASPSLLTYAVPADLQCDAVVYQDSAAKLAIGLAVCCVVGGLGTAAAWKGLDERFWVLGLAGTFGSVGYLWRLLRRRPRKLIVAADGVTDEVTGLGFIPYEQIVNLWSAPARTGHTLVLTRSTLPRSEPGGAWRTGCSARRRTTCRRARGLRTS